MLPSRHVAIAATLLIAAPLVALAGCPSRESVPNRTRYDDASVLDSGGPPPKIILLVGDGMGPGQLATASYFRHGAPESLALYKLPVRGQISTASPSGITDSAASATAMATGRYTWNGTVGRDQDDLPVQNLVELAKEYGLATGLVSSTRISHATPASFSAHVHSRGQYQDIAEQMAALRPDVILGGGVLDFEARSDGRNLSHEFEAGGYHVVHSATELSAAVPAESHRLLGLFADYHLSYQVDRGDDEDVPLLREMTTAALDRLDNDPQGFFLLVEGGRIDHASHENNIVRAIGETLDFDDTIAAVVEWAGRRDDVTILVTADHETGGLALLDPGSVGEVPRVSWRWGSHTNATVDLFGAGPGSQIFDGQVRDHRWIHSALAGLIRNRPGQPPRRIIADGRLGDLLGPTVAQTIAESSPGGARLTRLSLDSDEHGLGIGIEGLFPWSTGSTVLLIDVDYGGATGIRNLGALSDVLGSVDTTLSSAQVPAISDNGFGIDFAFLTKGGLEPKYEQLPDTAGLRELGTTNDLTPLRCAANFSDNARIYREGADITAGQGLEVFIRWEELYNGASAPPPAATLAVWALQLDDFAAATNQSLPPWPATSSGPAPSPLVITP